MFPESVIEFQLVADRPRNPVGYEYVSASISTDGQGIFLFVEKALAAKVLGKFKNVGGATFPDTKMKSGAAFKLIVVGHETSRVIDIPPLDITYPLCDLFCDGRVLLAGARCQWRGPDDFDKNGVIFDPKTGATKRLLLGDGISDLGVDSNDRIWVSYFDEGVFGNFGWSHPGPQGPGAGGLVCFDANGQELWAFNGPENPDFIDDCYALNVQRHELWAYYYSDFKMCRLDGQFEPVRFPSVPISGSKAFAVCSEGFLFSKQYRETAGTFHFLQREGNQMRQGRKLRGVLPNGTKFENSSMIGTGSCMHVLNDMGWFRTDLATQFG